MAHITLLVVLAFSCTSMPEDIPEDMSMQLFLKAVQEHINNLNWSAALLYLDEFKKRFSENQADLLFADYQIALISYKKGNYASALKQFEDILSFYEENDGLYEWVQILSQKIVDKINTGQ